MPLTPRYRQYPAHSHKRLEMGLRLLRSFGSSWGLTSLTLYMASIMYGAMSHWIMLKMITMNGINNILTPANDKMKVKNRVDKPMMIANVPTNEKRSFHKFKNLSPIMVKNTGAY